MKLSQTIFVTFQAILWLLAWYTKAFELEAFNPIIMVLLSSLVISSVGLFLKNKSIGSFSFLVAFLMILLGDVFLNFTELKSLHILSFAIAHIFLIIFFWAYSKKSMSFKFALPGLVLSVLAYLLLVVPKMPHTLAIPFAFYLLILTVMTWRAYAYAFENRGNAHVSLLLFFGASLFYLTDILVGIRILYAMPKINVLVYAIYPPSLILLNSVPWLLAQEYLPAART